MPVPHFWPGWLFSAIAKVWCGSFAPDRYAAHGCGHVRFAPKADKEAGIALSPLCANSD
jgi:hypothetical protein